MLYRVFARWISRTGYCRDLLMAAAFPSTPRGLVVREAVVDALDREGWGTRQIASFLGVNRTHVRRRIYEVRRERDATEEYSALLEHRLQYVATLSSRAAGGKQRALAYGNEAERVDLGNVLKRDGASCHICKELVEPEELDFDHVVPLSRGGSHTEANIAVSHAHCNRKKGGKLMSELAA